MSKPIVCYDVETTGLNPKEDFIIQLSAVKFNRETFEILAKKDWYIEPQHAYTINPKAQEVHGITKEFLKENGHPMTEVAPEFIAFAEDADLLTYNGNSFDIKFLVKDFVLAGHPEFEASLSGKKFYDAFGMECRLNPRNLQAIYEKYTGQQFENAHNSLADVEATIEVFKHQIQDNKLTFLEIDEYNENNLLSPDGTIRDAASPGEPRKIVFAFGKYKDSEFMETLSKDANYVKWFLDNVAGGYTKNILREYYKEHRPTVKK